MSRSYKHFPCCKDYNKGMKKIANRHIRRNNLEIPSGNFYKKCFCSWEISDYKFIRTFERYKKKNRDLYGDKYSDEELYESWCRYYKRK